MMVTLIANKIYMNSFTVLAFKKNPVLIGYSDKSDHKFTQYNHFSFQNPCAVKTWNHST